MLYGDVIASGRNKNVNAVTNSVDWFVTGNMEMDKDGDLKNAVWFLKRKTITNS